MSKEIIITNPDELPAETLENLSNNKGDENYE